MVRGNLERATALLEESLTLSQEAKDKELVAGFLMCLGIAATLGGDSEQAKAPLRESLTMIVEMERMMDVAEDLEGLARRKLSSALLRQPFGAISFRNTQLEYVLRPLR